MFSDDITKELSAKLDPAYVKSRSDGNMTLSYLEGWWTISEANRIFGFGNWNRETVELTENTIPTQNERGNYVVSFRAKVEIRVSNEAGFLVVRQGTGFGSGISKDIHKAYESAIKEAETDAMKRALMTFGNPFGLALYDKTQAGVGTNEPEYSKATIRMVSEINQLKTPPACVAWHSQNEREVNELPEEQKQEILDQYESKLKSIEDGTAKPGTWKWENVGAQDEWIEKAKGVFGACDTLTELATKQDKIQHKIQSLEMKRKMVIIDYIKKRATEIDNAAQAAEKLRAG